MPFGIWFALQFDFTAVRFGTWALLVAYALAASIWTVWLWMTGLRHVPAAQAGVFAVLLPVSAALVGRARAGRKPLFATAACVRHRTRGRGARDVAWAPNVKNVASPL
jgi:drug/metabolite transporter (DMT)-like permease